MSDETPNEPNRDALIDWDAMMRETVPDQKVAEANHAESQDNLARHVASIVARAQRDTSFAHEREVIKTLTVQKFLPRLKALRERDTTIMRDGLSVVTPKAQLINEAPYD
ncbi:MAG: hypothetical protein AAGM84_11435 [Pseudomonadota bacterium]